MMQGMNYGGFNSGPMSAQTPSFMGGGMPAQNNQYQIQNNGFVGRNVQPSYLQGRIVGNEQEIVSGEVPNDGSFAVFIKNDLKTIWAKAWMGDGLIHTNVYQKVEETSPTEANTDQNVLDNILAGLKSIDERLSKMEQRTYNYRPASNGRHYQKPKTNDQNNSQEVTKNESSN